MPYYGEIPEKSLCLKCAKLDKTCWSYNEVEQTHKDYVIGCNDFKETEL